MSPTLRFSTPPRLYIFPKEAVPYTTTVGKWSVLERFTPNVEAGIEAGRYEVVIERQVNDRSDMHLEHAIIDQLAIELDTLWPYVAGLPLIPGAISTISLVRYTGPIGWISNYTEVDEALQTGPLRVHFVEARNRLWVTLPFFPLRCVLDLRSRYTDANAQLRSLIGLHYAGLKAMSIEPRLFFYAKALELARVLLPGKSLRAKASSLPDGVSASLTHPLTWLFDVSNHRFDVRHVVRSSATGELHISMTQDERFAFEADADLVIRGVISKQLPCDLVYMKLR